MHDCRSQFDKIRSADRLAPTPLPALKPWGQG
jgi:hypothetical protein